MVVILGPDGSGKSSVIERLIDQKWSPAKSIRSMHLRPRLSLKGVPGAPVTDPHGGPPRGMFSSMVKLGYLLFIYNIGYLLKVWPLLLRSNLLVFDRYYHDMLVDPIRYRYGGPMWLAGVVGRLVPKPDLWLLLDAPPEVLQARKKEVPIQETRRQKEAYLRLVQGMSNGIIIDASQPIEQVVAEARTAILDHMAARTTIQHG